NNQIRTARVDHLPRRLSRSHVSGLRQASPIRIHLSHAIRTAPRQTHPPGNRLAEGPVAPALELNPFADVTYGTYEFLTNPSALPNFLGHTIFYCRPMEANNVIQPAEEHSVCYAVRKAVSIASNSNAAPVAAAPNCLNFPVAPE